MSEETRRDVPVLSATGITKWYGNRRSGRLHALDGVDITLGRGEILGLVGESGSGKSTLAKVLVGAVRQSSGGIWCDGQELTPNRDTRTRRRIQMIYQDPYSSLNPRMTIRSMLAELLRVHAIVARSEIPAELSRLMGLVGLDDSALDAYARQFSGGQRQRIAIARALAVRPDVLIADEPVSALDVSIQATILELFASLRSQLDLSILFIAHNLAVVQHVVDRIAVMYLGRVVERAPTPVMFSSPMHPYSQALIASVPRMRPREMESEPAIEGEPPSPIDLPTGCRFWPRCAYAQPTCVTQDPALVTQEPGHDVACHYAGELQSRTINKEGKIDEGLSISRF